MEILNVTAADWQDYADDVATCNVILESYINDVSERSYELRSETSKHDDVISTMLMTRDSETRTVFAVRVSAADNVVYDAMHTLDSMHCAAAAHLSESVARLTASTEHFVRKYFADK